MPFARICDALHLGGLTAEPVPLSGGFMHRMYALATTQGRYAVKLLNKEVMQRPGVLENYAAAEVCEALLEQHRLPILPALTIDGRKLHCIDGRYLYVFAYFDGAALPETAVTPEHSRCIGDALARIHRIRRRELPGHPIPAQPIDWPALTAALLSDDDARAEGCLMQDALPLLVRATEAADEALRRLPRIEALCHNDMDPKNVLWRGEDFRIIDLECLGDADPMQEMMDLAVSWGGKPLSEGCFRAFIGGYAAAGGTLPSDPAAVYDSRRNYLEWLAYSAVRALAEEADERRIGREQITATLDKIRRDLSDRERILRWMEDARTALPAE